MDDSTKRPAHAGYAQIDEFLHSISNSF
ncbi:hypothetical protein PSEUDO9AG_30048 [Pseudomonas sp. 9Ag]|nr:hypothetical protein PSEUDO9AG_30048 [Pseudomonas sp. 9Ag]